MFSMKTSFSAVRFLAALALSASMASSSQAATLTFEAAADSYVKSASPTSTYGSQAYVRVSKVSASDEVQGLFRFDVTGLPDTIESARLRVYAYDGTVDGPALYSTVTGWNESTVTWSTRPAINSGVLSDAGAISSQTWVEFEIPASVISGDGSYGFVLVSSSSDGMYVHSREATSTHRPQLVIATSDTPPPPGDTQAPSVPTNLTAGTVTQSEIPLTWSASTDDVGVTGYTVYKNGTPAATVSTPGYTFVDLACGTTYQLGVSAQDAAGNASAQAALSVSTAACPAPPPGSPDPRLACTGYPEPRVFVESQSWWTQTPGTLGSDFGHGHLGGCIPERETISSPRTVDVRVMLHDNPGQVAYASLVFKGTDYEKTVSKNYSIANMTCPQGTCSQWISFTIDPALFDHAGLQEVRYRLFIDEPDGQRMTVSLNFQVNIENGKSRANVTRQPYLRGKGWYTQALYCEASLVSVPVPDAPVSGIWSPVIRIQDHGDGDLPVTHHSVRIDPDFHASPPVPGTILRDGSGQFLEAPVAIDTTTLSNGTHTLHLRADCDDPRGSTNSGVLVVKFKVQN